MLDCKLKLCTHCNALVCVVMHVKLYTSMGFECNRGWGGGGGGGYSPQILVGMCRGKVKNGQGLQNELPVERENVGLRNELESF